jgi:hypothetical protein
LLRSKWRMQSNTASLSGLRKIAASSTENKGATVATVATVAAPRHRGVSTGPFKMGIGDF